MNHPDAWPEGTEDETLCGAGWMDYWTSSAGSNYGEHWNLLAHQYIAANLNLAAGAEPSANVIAALEAAAELLEACAPVPDADEASALATTLDQFNNGLAGTNHCDKGGTSGGDDTGNGDTDGDDTDGGETSGGECVAFLGACTVAAECCDGLLCIEGVCGTVEG